MIRQTCLILGLALSCLLATATSFAQETKNDTQNWFGKLDVKVAKLRLQMSVTKADDGSFSGALISIDQGGAEMKFDRLEIADGKVEFEVKPMGVVFKGKLNEAGDEVEGTFTQGGQSFPLSFKKSDKAPVEKHIQNWQGVLKAGGQEFDFQFRVFEDSEGSMSVKLDSFSEKIVVTGDMKVEGSEVTITIPATAAVYVGTLDDERKTIEGFWKQSGGEFPLTLTSSPLGETREMNLNRPQTPQAPFDYYSEDFEIRVADFDEKYDEETVLAGTLTAPQGSGPFPTLIMISGSGPQDRDEQLFQHRPFLVIADYLAKRGYAVIRFDDRGVAKSKGNFATATSADFSEDVEAIYRYAKAHKLVDADKIILCGHSEGGLIAPMVAARNPQIAGVIMLAGPGVSGGKITINQSRKIAAVSGASEEVLKMQDKMVDLMLKQLATKDGFTKEFAEQLKKQLEEEFKDLEGVEAIIDSVEGAVGRMNSPWFKFFVAYDPSENLSKTHCPVLAMVGSNDLQVDPELNQPAIEAALNAGGNKDMTLVTIPGLNHLFQTSETGAVGDYMKIEETISQSALDTLTNWLDKRFK